MKLKHHTIESAWSNVKKKKWIEVFYRVKHHEAQPSGFGPDKTRVVFFCFVLTASKALLAKKVRQ